MNRISTRILFSGLLLLLIHPLLPAQGIIINEASNGTGSGEYFEFVVVGADPTVSCATVDLRNWIFDDNNGDFSDGASSGEGIATGHARFQNVPAWSAIPVGAIMLVYNPLDKNLAITLADDPYDANNDSVYIIPLNNPDIEFCGESPNMPAFNNDSYGCTTYLGFSASNGSRRWDAIQMANGGDAAQTRLPDGTYFHGFSYGNGGDLGFGGPDSIHIGTSSASGRNFSFDNSTDNDFRNSNNFSRGSVSGGNETPGLVNSVANGSWIQNLRCYTILPVSLTHFQARDHSDHVQLSWTTTSENQNAYFVIEKSGIEGDFEAIGQLSGAGTTASYTTYEFSDLDYTQEAWYRLRQVDFNGTETYSNIIGVLGKSSTQFLSAVFPNPAFETAHFQFSNQVNASHTLSLQLFDLQGQLIRETRETPSAGEGEIEMQVSDLRPGLYMYRVIDLQEMQVKNGKIRIK